MLIHSFYKDLIVDHEKEINFWILITFLVTFILARLNSFLFPLLIVDLSGLHVHHLTWGIIIVAVTGFLALSARGKRIRTILAILYGFGLGLAFDEFGLWLRLKNEYWVLHSYTAIIIIAVLLINAAYFYHFWKNVFKHLVFDHIFHLNRL